MSVDTVGGVWTYALDLADAMAARGVTVSLATMGPGMSADQRSAVAESPVAGVHESSFALEWMADPWADVDRAGQWLLALEDDLQPDVVHLNGYVHGALDWRAPAVVAAHSCVLSWWWAVYGEAAPPLWSEYRRRVAEGLRAADAVVAPTEDVLAGLRRWYGLAGGQVIPNCRRSDWVRPTAKDDLILGSGRLWDEGKNLAALDRVAPDLPWPVAIAGDPGRPDGGEPYGSAGATLLGRLGRAEMDEWLLRAAVFVLPARYEPFGLGPLEAGLAGCALVLGDIPSLREVWGDAALYVAPDDEAALRRILHRLATEPAWRAHWAGRARRRAMEFEPGRTADAYHRLYAAVAAEPGVRA